MAAETAAERKLSVGKKVSVHDRGALGRGKVVEVQQTDNRGEYVVVEFGDKKTGTFQKKFRPSKLSRWS